MTEILGTQPLYLSSNELIIDNSEKRIPYFVIFHARECSLRIAPCLSNISLFNAAFRWLGNLSRLLP